MWACELPITSPEEALRAVRALGKHRYVAGRLHAVHALAAADLPGELGDWARAVLVDDAIDKASRDERLVRRAADDDLLQLLGWFWRDDTHAQAADALLDRVERFELDVTLPDDEDEVFPLLVDAGWELLALSELDPERHRGAIEAYGERIQYEVACFEEREHLPPVVHLQELPALGLRELVAPPEELTLWLSGNETYQDYVVRGVLRAAKLGP